ncbi:B12-binding domain-containing radical SAM protein [candidate division KSB1 bacterium]
MKQNTKIMLARLPMDNQYPEEDKLSGLHGAPPTGLAILANAIKRKVPGAEIRIYDGYEVRMDFLKYEISQWKPDIVGATDQYPEHRNVLRLLEHGKSVGALTFAGGSNASNLAERIVLNRDFVDGVVKGDGEDSLSETVLRLSRGEEYNDFRKHIPNLVYADRGDAVENEMRYAKMDLLFDFDDMMSNGIDNSKAVEISSVRGCLKAQEKNKCSYCTVGSRYRTMDPELVWEQIGILHKKYGYTLFFESGDTLANKPYLRKLIENRPLELSDVGFRAYCTPMHFTEEMASLFKELNVKRLFLGIESVNNEILANTNRNYTEDHIHNAMVYAENFPLQLPFLLGLPGETQETLEKNYQFVKEVLARKPDTILLASPVIPLAGSSFFHELSEDERVNNEYPGDLKKDDLINYRKLIEIYVPLYTECTLEMIFDYSERMKGLAQKGKSTTWPLTCQD